MTDHGQPSETTEQAQSLRARLRALLRRVDPTSLGLLGVLSLPAHLSDSFAVLELFSIFFLFFLWVFVEPLLDMVLARGDGGTEPTDWIEAGGTRDLVVAYLLLPLTMLNPLALTQDLLQLFGRGVAHLRYRGAVPDAESYEQQASYRLPFDGTWTAVNGSPEKEFSHSWVYVNQRYAYDFVITDEAGRSRPAGSGSALENYYCYDEPVLAPADGVVVDAYDTELESSRGGGLSHPLKRDIRGGYVVIKHADSEYSTLAHLVPGSVAVEPGDQVRKGEQLARCGHTGNSSEPHLHFQVQDHPNFALAASLPIQFENVTVEEPGVAHDQSTIPAGRPGDDGVDRTYVLAGQRVTPTDSPASQQHSADGDANGPGAFDRLTSAPRRLTSTAQQTAMGVTVGGVLTFAAGLVTSGLGVALVLGTAAASGLAFRVLYRPLGGPGGQRRGVGTSLGVAIAAAVVAGAAVSGAVGLGTLTGVLLLAGVAGFAAFGEVERGYLRTTPVS